MWRGWMHLGRETAADKAIILDSWVRAFPYKSGGPTYGAGLQTFDQLTIDRKSSLLLAPSFNPLNTKRPQTFCANIGRALLYEVSTYRLLTMNDLRRTIVTEGGCFATTFERKYYKKKDMFVKRSLRESEYQMGYRGLHVPKLGIERLRNEAASLEFVRKFTKVPVPLIYDHFEYDGAYYIAMEYVEGVNMSALSDDQKNVVVKEIEVHLSIMHTLTSNKIGGPSGIIIPPYRILEKVENSLWNPLTDKGRGYVFCHMDLSQHNIIVDPKTLKVKAIIDFECSGFWPERFDLPFYTRLGPSVARGGEIDDTPELLDFLTSGT